MEQIAFLDNSEQIFTVSDVNRLVAGVVRAVPLLQDCWVTGELMLLNCGVGEDS